MSLAYTFDGHLAAIARQQIVQSEVDSYLILFHSISTPHGMQYLPTFPAWRQKGRILPWPTITRGLVNSHDTWRRPYGSRVSSVNWKKGSGFHNNQC